MIHKHVPTKVGVTQMKNEAVKPERELTVHPAADIFPMMSDEELQELAADIARKGLIDPIVTDESGTILIDGRNRLAACKIAGILPTFAVLVGLEPDDYILSKNLERRTLNKGQKAMAVAMVKPNAEHGGKRDKGSSVVSQLDFSKTRLSRARSVLRYSLPLAQEVMAGTTSLDEALEAVRQHEVKISGKEAQLQRLRTEAPDLADLVSEERMSLPEAQGALNERNSMRERIRQSGRIAAKDLDLLKGTVESIAHAMDLGEVNLIDSALVEKTEQACTSLRKLLERKSA